MIVLETNDFNYEVHGMHDLNNSLSVIFLFAVLFSFFVLPIQPGLAEAEESSASSKVTFHVA